MTVEFLLHAAPGLVQGVTGQAGDVERIHEGGGVEQLAVVAVLSPVNPSIATTSTCGRHSSGLLVSHVSFARGAEAGGGV